MNCVFPTPNFLFNFCSWFKSIF